MSLVDSNLTNAIKTAIQNEVNRCIISGEFKPSMFDNSIYLNAIYNYIKDNADIKVTYIGTIPGTPPVTDPLNGQHTLKAASVSNAALRSAVLLAQNSMTSFPPTPWWTALITSLLITSQASDGQITLAPVVIPQAVSTKVWSGSDFKIGSDWMNNFEQIWGVYSKEIIKAVKASVFPTPVATTSTSGGVGTSTFISIT